MNAATKSKASHTPGPWRVGDREPYVEVWGRMDMNAHPIVASLECEPRGANARLIAAAPDMLSALKSVDALGMLNPTGSGAVEDAARAVKAAIAKAEVRP